MRRGTISAFAIAYCAALGCAAVFAMRQVDEAIDEAFGDVVDVPEGLKAATGKSGGEAELLRQRPSGTHKQTQQTTLRTRDEASFR